MLARGQCRAEGLGLLELRAGSPAIMMYAPLLAHACIEQVPNASHVWMFVRGSFRSGSTDTVLRIFRSQPNWKTPAQEDLLVRLPDKGLKSARVYPFKKDSNSLLV